MLCIWPYEKGLPQVVIEYVPLCHARADKTVPGSQIRLLGQDPTTNPRNRAPFPTSPASQQPPAPLSLSKSQNLPVRALSYSHVLYIHVYIFGSFSFLFLRRRDRVDGERGHMPLLSLAQKFSKFFFCGRLGVASYAGLFCGHELIAPSRLIARLLLSLYKSIYLFESSWLPITTSIPLFAFFGSS